MACDLTPESAVAASAGDGGWGGDAGGGDGRGGGGCSEGPDGEDSNEVLSLVQAEELAAARGVQLPDKFFAAAAAGGLYKSVLERYIRLQGSSGLNSFLSRMVPFMRDRLLADPRYCFIVLAEVGIDTGCATVAEVRKRGKDFWAEFEFYLSDLIVGIVLDVVLVTLMAPAAKLGPASARNTNGLRRALGRVPSAVFAQSAPGAPRYRPADRLACMGVKFLEYSLAGMVCGFVGQGFANGLMNLKRHCCGRQEGDVEVPDVVMTALVWGLFMGVSSNLRYQAVFGLERLVDRTIAKRVPNVAYGTSFALRFANNVVGGENFIDMARWAGIQ
ncbi:hypothetical protein WJX81_005466 [Elliptochloris bilobata]|uniref:Uncharacterized protein n=1 Tax=Elliptochloris bilobata TaxID=381761 RepID=A0AAW1QA53_9CHLO